ncbi:MAG: hypothetical protein K0S23_1917 [Fluviicola sp.]|jgi:hypothetical protein|uniref:hypothetical protein n=1 Tax=Fluviicola sp. TaxID=1917219 RepID=UPI0026326EF3|nr:hypothetical protein [Fluviicola sp.]MDF3027610.1 hypothetical protein [Fluviicola sp.]
MKKEKIICQTTKPASSFSICDPRFIANKMVRDSDFDLRAALLGVTLIVFSTVQGFSQTGSSQTTFKFEIKDTSNLHTELLKTSSVECFDHREDSSISGTIHASKKDFQQITIQLKNSRREVLKTLHPNSNGNFELDYNWQLSPMYLEFSGPDYKTLVLYIPGLRSFSNIVVELLPE